MSLNYAEKWEQEILEAVIQGSLISPFITTNVKWVGAKTFHFTQMSTSGFKTHSREGGWNKGTYAQNDNTYSVAHDRDISFLVDKADVDETNQTASIKNISMTFEKLNAIPEMDAQFYSKVYAYAKKVNRTSNTAITAYTKDNVLSKVLAVVNKVKKYRDSVLTYISSEIMDLLAETSQVSKNIEVTTLAEGGHGIETRIAKINGYPLVEIIDDERFYTEFDFTDGFKPKVGSFKINILAASILTTKFVPKISSIYFFEPGKHTEGDGYLYQNRQLWDTFVFPNGKTNEVDSVFVDIDTTAVTAPADDDDE